MLPILYQQNYIKTLSQLHHQLPIAGLDVKVSFQMSGALLRHDCESGQCRCGMAVVLVYGNDPHPATLWVRGQAGRSWISVDESVGHQISAEFEHRLKRALQTW